VIADANPTGRNANVATTRGNPDVAPPGGHSHATMVTNDRPAHAPTGANPNAGTDANPGAVPDNLLADRDHLFGAADLRLDDCLDASADTLGGSTDGFGASLHGASHRLGASFDNAANGLDAFLDGIDTLFDAILDGTADLLSAFLDCAAGLLGGLLDISQPEGLGRWCAQ
jgi:hypothetical protein